MTKLEGVPFNKRKLIFPELKDIPEENIKDFPIIIKDRMIKDSFIIGIILLFWAICLFILGMITIFVFHRIELITYAFKINNALDEATNNGIDDIYGGKIIDKIKDEVEEVLDEYYCDKKLNIYRSLSNEVKNQKGSLLMIFNEVDFLGINESAKKTKILLIIDICFILAYHLTGAILLILNGLGNYSDSNLKIYLLAGTTVKLFERAIVGIMNICSETDEINNYNKSKIKNIFYFYNECSINKEEFRTFYGEVLNLKFYHIRGIVTFFINMGFILILILVSLLLSMMLHFIIRKIFIHLHYLQKILYIF